VGETSATPLLFVDEAHLVKDTSDEPSRKLTQPIEAVVFDLGGVIATDMVDALDWLWRVHGRRSRTSRERLKVLWRPLYIEATLGRISPDQLWERLRRDAPLALPPGQEEAAFLTAIGLRDSSIAPTMAALRGKYKVGLLSNYVGRWARALLERFELSPMLDAVLISSDLGARKPDLITYQSICRLLNVAPQRAIYIADEEGDLVGAAAAGMVPIFVPGEDSFSRIGLAISRAADLLTLLA